MPLVEQAPLDRPRWQAASARGWSAAAGSLRPPREPGLCARTKLRPGIGPAASDQGTPVVAASVRRKAKGPAWGALEWPHLNLKGPVQSESGRALVPIARRSIAQQL